VTRIIIKWHTDAALKFLEEKMDESWIRVIVVSVVLVLGFPIFHVWRERHLAKEFERNKKFDPPESDQLKWDFRHIREDINLLCHLMMILVTLEVLRML
jgi:hypothetical protein